MAYSNKIFRSATKVCKIGENCKFMTGKVQGNRIIVIFAFRIYKSNSRTMRQTNRKEQANLLEKRLTKPFANTPQGYGNVANAFASAPQWCEKAANMFANIPQGHERFANAFANAPQGCEMTANAFANIPQGYERVMNALANAPQGCEKAANTFANGIR